MPVIDTRYGKAVVQVDRDEINLRLRGCVMTIYRHSELARVYTGEPGDSNDYSSHYTAGHEDDALLGALTFVRNYMDKHAESSPHSKGDIA